MLNTFRTQYLPLLGSLALLALLYSPVTTAYAAVTPEAVQQWVDAKFIFIGMAVGLLWKYLPQLKTWTNALIPWLTMATYVIGKVGAVGSVALVLGGEPAHAGGLTIATAGTLVLAGAGNAVFARQGWEGFLRPIVEFFYSTLNQGKRHPAE